MTITEDSTTTTTTPNSPSGRVAAVEVPGFELVAFDLYRDIHKGIRTELFAVTSTAGSLDPTDVAGWADVASNVRSVVDFLVSHAEHEDRGVQPSIEAHLPDLAQRIEREHHLLEARMDVLVELAAAVDATAGTARARTHHLYLELASFTGDYLAHQDVEERVVMPALEAAIGLEAVIGIHGAIIGNIPPQELAESMAIMLPSMNVDDRTEMLGGMRASAPAEVFDGVWSLAGSVLTPADRGALAARLGLA